MYDWDEQELANIIWGEAAESGDHIFPFPGEIGKTTLQLTLDHGKTELNEEDANSRAAEENIVTAESNSSEIKLHENDSLSCAKGSMDPKAGTCLAAASLTGHNGAEAAVLQHDHENPNCRCEDEELGELVDNSWASIGSFEDLDHIFSNNDSVAHSNICSEDELWSSSRDLIGDVDKSSSLALDSARWGEGTLGNASGQFEINTESLSDQNSSFILNHGKGDYSTSCARQSLSASLDQVEHMVGTTPLLSEKMADDLGPTTEKHENPEKILGKKWSRSQSKKHHKNAKRKDQLPVYSNQQQPALHIPQFGSHSAQVTVQNYPSSITSQKRFPKISGSSVYQHIPDLSVSGCIYGNIANQYAASPLMQSTDDEHPSVLSSADTDVGSLNRPPETSAKPLNMTPQEKIEKLRRRQKMRAMLAIQKQQQQLSHQVSATSYSFCHKSALEDHSVHMELSSICCEGNLRILPSGVKQDDSNATSLEEDGSTVEDRVLQQLQDIINNLDITIRLCIRDSLFRLAQSAMQRHYVNETSSTDRSRASDHAAAKEGMSSSGDRLAGPPVVETETNHIDRVVAHLLFHRPFKLSVKPTGTLESSTSMKAPPEQQTDLSSPPQDYLTCAQSQYNLSPRASKLASVATESRQEGVREDLHQVDDIMNQSIKRKKGGKEECLGNDDGDI